MEGGSVVASFGYTRRAQMAAWPRKEVHITPLNYWKTTAAPEMQKKEAENEMEKITLLVVICFSFGLFQ
jgi:hypothetical protein